MATLYRRPRSPFWYYVFTVDGQKIRASTGKTLKAEAQHVLDEEVRKFSLHRSVDPGRVRYKDAVVRFFTERDLKPKTQTEYLRAARQWSPYLDDLYLDQIDHKILNRFVSERRAYLKQPRQATINRKGQRYVPPKATRPDVTIRRELAYLSAVFKLANIGINPVRIYDKSGLLNARERTRALTKAEFDRLIDFCKRRRTKVLYKLVMLACDTGLRKEELMSLTRSQCDMHPPHIKLYDDQTKSDKPRIVLLSSLSVSMLSDTLASHNYEHVFVRPVSGRRYKRVDGSWRQALKAAGIVGFKWHDLRHTWATWYLNDGGDRFALRDQLGHANISTSERYAHLEMETRIADLEQVQKRRTHKRTH